MQTNRRIIVLSLALVIALAGCAEGQKPAGISGTKIAQEGIGIFSPLGAGL